MATWKGVITNAGSSILNEWVNEKTLNFDSAAAGQGTVPAQAMLAQTALVSQKQTASLLGGEEVDTGIRLKIRITAPDTAYTLNQYGVFASVDGGESVLIALFQIDAGIPIPSKTESPDFVYTFYALIMCSNTGTWTVTIDTSVCVTAEDMQKAIETAVASCESLLKNADVKNSITDSDSVAIVDSADSSKTKRVLWSTIKSTLEKVFTPNTRKINNKDLSKDLTLTGEDINVSKSDSTKIKTALSNKADKAKPKRYDFLFSEEFQRYQPCEYWKNEFGEVTLQLSAFENKASLVSGNEYTLGYMPEGYRPIHQIYFVGFGNRYYQFYHINGEGKVRLLTRSDISPNDFNGATISYIAE